MNLVSNDKGVVRGAAHVSNPKLDRSVKFELESQSHVHL